MNDDVSADLTRGLEDALNNENLDGLTAPVEPQGQPSSPAGNGASQQAAPVAPSPEAVVPQPWEKLGYADPETAYNSVVNLRNYASRTKDEATQLREENATLKQQMASGFGRQSPAGLPQGYGQAPAADSLDRLESEYHVPRQLLEPGVNQLVDAKVNEILQPFIKAAQADQKAVETYGPEYLTLKPRIDAFVASDPRTAYLVNAARMAGQPELANELAVTKFREAVFSSTHQQMTAAAGATTAATQAARSHAGVLAGRGEETRNRITNGQAGQPVDRAEAIARANAGDDSMIERGITNMLPFSEADLQKAWYGGTNFTP
jgi:hypothetical protein